MIFGMPRLSGLSVRNVGYPCNQDYDFSELFRFLHFSANNVGDPFHGTNYRLNTMEFEREVLADFARYTCAPADEWWGYVTSGGTEGTRTGLMWRVSCFPTAFATSARTRITAWPASFAPAAHAQHHDQEPAGRPDGLRRPARNVAHPPRRNPHHLCQYWHHHEGGPVDDLARIRAILDDLAIVNAYIHADAALSGMILPFVDEPQPWNFADGADSISISGHKMLGAPVPCGVVLARKANVDRIARSIEYIGALDTTIAGSRSAFSPLLLGTGCARLGTTV